MRRPIAILFALACIRCTTDGAAQSLDAGNDSTKDAPPDRAEAEVGAPDVVDAGADVAESGADAAPDVAACGKFNEPCCGSGPACGDVTLSCVAQLCKHVMVVTGLGAQYDINGVAAPALTLKAGVTYTFDLTAVPSYHPWIFTSSSVGGVGATAMTSSDIPGYGGVDACSSCPATTLTITPSASPAQFYYQCHYHQLFGNQVTVVP